LMKRHRKKSHTVRSGDRGGQVQKVLSVAAARATHRPGTVHLGIPGPPYAISNVNVYCV